MVLLAGVAWGISGVSGQYLMGHGMDVHLLTSLRLIISGLILSALACWRQKEQVVALITSQKQLRELLIYSLLGLGLNQYAYLLAIRYSNAGTATVLQYLSPILVLVFVSLKAKRLPSLSETLAIILAIVGTAIMAFHGDLAHLAISPIGLFWGIFSALTYAYCVIKPVKLIEEWGSLLVIGLAMLMGGYRLSSSDQSLEIPSSFNSRQLDCSSRYYWGRNPFCLYFFSQRSFSHWAC